jgi:hypothetical protein
MATAQEENSLAPRRPASAVASITGIRISPPGFRATLLNISGTGLLAEWGLPLKIGQAVTIEFEGAFAHHSVRAQVVRSSVASTTAASLRYHVALEFMAPIGLDDEAQTTADAQKPPAAAAADPARSDDVVNDW